MTDLRAAAAERSRSVAQRADRPSQRRSAESAVAPSVVRAVLAGVQLRAKEGTTLLQFAGHASVVERAYEMWDYYGPYQEIVSAAAFDKTLARADLDVPLVLNHDQMRRMARTTTGTLRLSMDDQGLFVDADLDPADADVSYIAPKLLSGLIDEMSFAFRINSGQWSPDYSEYRINEVEIHRGDVAIVGWGANPATDAALRTSTASAGGGTRLKSLLDLAIAG